jgi:hypothetical protein
VQRRANQRKVATLDLLLLQAPAYPRNACIITRNEQVSGSSPLVGSLFCSDFQVKRRAQRDLGAKAEPNLLQRAERGTLGRMEA